MCLFHVYVLLILCCWSYEANKISVCSNESQSQMGLQLYCTAILQDTLRICICMRIYVCQQYFDPPIAILV